MNTPLPFPASIGFPPPLLGPAPLRITVLAATPGVLALEKPAGLCWDDETVIAATTASTTAIAAPSSSIVAALRRQLDAGKPELRPLALERPVPVWPLETEAAGIGLLVSRDTELNRWRNAFGSEQLCFHYVFLARGGEEHGAGFECSLPVARHISKPVALVSHITGKKRLTRFRRLTADSNAADVASGISGIWTWWEAETRYPRFHQIRLHAAECGLRIAGETRYTDAGAPVLEQFLRKGRLNKGEARPLLDGLCLRLARVDCTGAGIPGWGLLTAPEPPKCIVLRKRMNLR